MRAVINKGNREEDLLRAVESIFQNGWSLLKLYFMIGLPEETDEDVVAIARLAKRCLHAARRALPKGEGSATINLGASTFVPKPFTPFQWEPMIGGEETRRRQQLITAELGGRNGAIQFKPHDARPAAIEGALALGDRRVGTAILAAFRAGQRLDGWSEWFDEQRWQDAFRGDGAGARGRARLLRPPAAPARRGPALGSRGLRRHEAVPRRSSSPRPATRPRWWTACSRRAPSAAPATTRS